MEEYDNDGYQNILEDYKIHQRIKVKEEQKEIAKADYLQAKNNFNNYSNIKALLQINEALLFDSGNVLYLFLKAQILTELSEYDESLNVFYMVIKLNIDDTLRSNSFNNMGLNYKKKNDCKKALEYYGKALTIQEKVFGKEHPFTAISYNNIGLTYYENGNYEKALDYVKKALSIDEKLLNKGDPTIASMYNNIATIYNAKSDFKMALEYCEKALTINEIKFGKEDIHSAVSYNNIGFTYEQMGDLDKALDYYVKALAINEIVFGKEYNRTAILYNNIGVIYKKKGDFDKALEYYGKALAIYEKALDKNLLSCANTYNNIGAAYNGKIDYDKALEYFENALRIREKVLGKEDIKTIDVYMVIGLLYITKGDKEKGLSFLAKTEYSKLSAYDKSDFLNQIGLSNFKMNKYNEAIIFFKIALDFLKESNPPKIDALYAIIYYNMAMTYCYNKQKDKALPLFEEAISLLSKEVKEGEIDIQEVKRNYEKCKAD